MLHTIHNYMCGVVGTRGDQTQAIAGVDKRILMAGRCTAGWQDNNSEKAHPELFQR